MPQKSCCPLGLWRLTRVRRQGVRMGDQGGKDRLDRPALLVCGLAIGAYARRTTAEGREPPSELGTKRQIFTTSPDFSYRVGFRASARRRMVRRLKRIAVVD